VWDHVNVENGCEYFRTEVNCDVNEKVTFTVTLPLVTAMAAGDAPGNLLDPFIFAADNHYHGSETTDGNYRGLEIHIKNQEPTEAFNTELFSAGADDVSDASTGIYFQTTNGIPFAMAIGTPWRHPQERVDINRAYSKFSDFATNNGASSPLWFNTVDTDITIQLGAEQ